MTGTRTPGHGGMMTPGGGTPGTHGATGTRDLQHHGGKVTMVDGSPPEAMGPRR